jgi:SsrA-binding protein
MSKVFAQNQKAIFNYDLLEKYEAGLVLIGQEVKSIRLGRANLQGSYIIPKKQELWLTSCYIPPYQPKNAPDYWPQRDRKLLLTKKELSYLLGKTTQKGLTLLPLKIYTDNGKLKLEFGLARIIKKGDKREKIKKREIEKEMKQAVG